VLKLPARLLLLRHGNLRASGLPLWLLHGHCGPEHLHGLRPGGLLALNFQRLHEMLRGDIFLGSCDYQLLELCPGHVRLWDGVCHVYGLRDRDLHREHGYVSVRLLLRRDLFECGGICVHFMLDGSFCGHHW